MGSEMNETLRVMCEILEELKAIRLLLDKREREDSLAHERAHALRDAIAGNIGGTREFVLGR